MRINYVLPAVHLTGGVRVIVEIAEGLARRGHQVTLTAFGKDGDLDWFRHSFACRFIERARFHKYRVAAARRLMPGWHEQDHKIRALAARVPECDINVATAAFTAFSVTRSGRGVPFHHMQHYDAVFYPDDPYARQVAIEACCLPMRRIANSRWLAGILQERHGIADTALVYPAIDHEVFRPAPVGGPGGDPADSPGKGNGHAGGFRIVALGRSDPVKGFADLLEAVALAGRRGCPVDLVVFGGEKDLPQREGSPYRHAGRRINRDLADLYRSAGAVVTPSWYESFPLPPLEAMACGVAVITTRDGTEDYAEDGRNALVVPAREPGRLADAIVRLAGDETLRRRLAAQGPMTARAFTWDAAVDRVEELFAGTLATLKNARPQAPGRNLAGLLG